MIDPVTTQRLPMPVIPGWEPDEAALATPIPSLSWRYPDETERRKQKRYPWINVGTTLITVDGEALPPWATHRSEVVFGLMPIPPAFRRGPFQTRVAVLKEFYNPEDPPCARANRLLEEFFAECPEGICGLPQLLERFPAREHLPLKWLIKAMVTQHLQDGWDGIYRGCCIWTHPVEVEVLTMPIDLSTTNSSSKIFGG